MPELNVPGTAVRRALYESVAENLPAQHGALLMALERGVRFGQALESNDATGIAAREALPLVQALADGSAGLDQAQAMADAVGLQRDTLVDAAAALRVKRDPSEHARAVCTIAAQIEAAMGPEPTVVVSGRVWNKIKKGTKKGVSTVTKTAHKITHTGPIAKLEKKLQDTVVKALPITKPFIDFHNKVASKFTEKVLQKGGLIDKDKPKPKAKSVAKAAVPAASAKSVLSAVQTAVKAPAPASVLKSAVSAPAAKPKPPGAKAKAKKAPAHRTQIKARSGKVYDVAVRLVS